MTWLTSPRMAAALRTGYNPASAPGLATEHLRGDPAAPGLPLAAAGPTLAPPRPPAPTTTTRSPPSPTRVLMPENGLIFGSLGPLLAVRTAGERRTLAIHYEVLPPQTSARVGPGAEVFQPRVVIEEPDFAAFDLRGIVLALFPVAQLARDGNTEPAPSTESRPSAAHWASVRSRCSAVGPTRGPLSVR